MTLNEGPPVLDSDPSVLRMFYSRLPNGLILNIGSGRTAAAASTAEQAVISGDLAPTGREGGPTVRCDVQHLPFRPASFDGILAKDVLEHVGDFLLALRELRRVVKIGGSLVVVVPRAIPRAVWDDVTHVRGFTRRALEGALAHTGWMPEGAPRRMGGVPGVARLRLQWCLPALLRLPGLGHRFGTNWMVVATAAPSIEAGIPT